jgi:hypothetical protein
MAKFIAKVLLVILTIPIFIVLVLSVNIRFQFMSPVFWLGSFEKADVYSQISANIKSRLDSKVVADGGSISDIEVLSNLVSAASLKTFVEDNISSILTYANGHSKEIIVSMPLPTKTLPVNLDFQEVGSLTEKLTLTEFVKEYNISGFNESDIARISKFGIWSWELLVLSFAVFVLVFVLMYLLVDSKKRMVVPGIALAISGLVAMAIYFMGELTSSTLSVDFVGTTNLGSALLAILAPPLIQNTIHIWIWFGISSIVLGISLIFIKKPAYNKNR